MQDLYAPTGNFVVESDGRIKIQPFYCVAILQFLYIYVSVCRELKQSDT